MPSSEFSSLPAGMINGKFQFQMAQFLGGTSLVSGAFHDALFISRILPSAMIFVPCRGGVSHNEAESVSDDHVILGARTLLEVAIDLANRTSLLSDCHLL
ncbi:M20/M25/M40 family metallo-hydrolase [Xaviernesmea oryzae]|uniref:M20/M25/M40 family metallo-hydrolase n=1 Tax=Xaviernesmea oryzae TaxID=464029 RepID=UPI0009F832C6